MRLLAIVLSASVLMACGHSTGPHGTAPPDENTALLVALQFFAKQLEAQEITREGIILLEPKTRVWTKETLEGFSDDRQDACAVPEDLYQSLVERSVSAREVVSVIPQPGLWEIAPESLPSEVSPLPPLQFDGRRIRTIVSVSRPGFAVDGKDALVLVYFTWSIHDALARVRLVRQGPGWRGLCAQFNFYV